jgi:zinc finger protein 830
MADARSLLRVKRQEARISHPLASYNAAGQLRCNICGTLVKFASAWEGHLGSKAHRTNVARVKEEERIRAAQEKAEMEEEEEEEERKENHKRKNEDEEDSDSTSASKRQKLDVNAGFPADFFSDPSAAPVFTTQSDDEEDDRPQPPPVANQPPSAIDLEYEQFQKSLLETPDFRETYERATVFAEPELAAEIPEGFPERTEEVAEAQPAEATEEEKRQQKEIEEKELIMDRFIEEERAQEEADMKVQMMKNKLEMFKREREASRAAKKALR